jgi:ATP synthase protein I
MSYDPNEEPPGGQLDPERPAAPRDRPHDDTGAAATGRLGGPARGGSAGPTPPEERGPSAATYAGLGFQFVGAILLFLYLGRWLDGKLGTTPWLLIVGVFVGAGAAFYSLYRKLMREQAREDARRAARKTEGLRP